MEEVQKNENGTTVPQADGKPKKEDKPKRELTPQQVQQRRKMIVFPLMFLAFAGCMYLIFAPSGKEDVNVESVGGFNADIPLPAEDGIIADKQKAYEQAVTSRKQQDKIQSLQDFGFTLDDDTEEPQEEINLMPEEDPKPQRGGGTSSRAAYRDINRQLSTFYETPPVDEEKEELKRQVAELTDRLKQQQNATPTADDQMALLEKSYELAAKYMNGQDGQRGQIAQIPTAGQNGAAAIQPCSDFPYKLCNLPCNLRSRNEIRNNQLHHLPPARSNWCPGLLLFPWRSPGSRRTNRRISDRIHLPRTDHGICIIAVTFLNLLNSMLQ